VGCREVADAFRGHASGKWLSAAATVSRLLPDSYGRFQHQRFVVRCPSGQTVLIVNDVSVGTRVPAVTGDHIVVRGRYFYNAQGGLMDFTHHDPEGGTGGWILDGGKIYAFGQTGLPRTTKSSPLGSTVISTTRIA
jgi:hypothetical protein